MIQSTSTKTFQYDAKRRVTADRAGLFLGFLLLLTLPLMVQSNDYILQVFTHALLLASLALAWNLLGVSGSISLGHAAFFGV
ncbi:MAG: hypothetical protein KKF96_05565, partial [Proteobacteria bacterium]|nr:hypothetical protein [Pseudomonadota bacterium]